MTDKKFVHVGCVSFLYTQLLLVVAAADAKFFYVYWLENKTKQNKRILNRQQKYWVENTPSPERKATNIEEKERDRPNSSAMVHSSE